jgi:hypothetical protein
MSNRPRTLIDLFQAVHYYRSFRVSHVEKLEDYCIVKPSGAAAADGNYYWYTAIHLDGCFRSSELYGEDGKYAGRQGEKAVGEGAAKIDPATTPKSVDFTSGWCAMSVDSLEIG